MILFIVKGSGNFSHTELFNNENESFASVRPAFCQTCIHAGMLQAMTLFIVEGSGNFSHTEVFNKQNESFTSVRPMYMGTEYYFVRVCNFVLQQ